MLCDIASGYEQLASRVCGWQIGIIGQIELIAAAGVAPEKRGSCARKKGNLRQKKGEFCSTNGTAGEVSMEAEGMAIGFAVLPSIVRKMGFACDKCS